MYETLLQLPLFQGLSHEDFTHIIGKVKLDFTKHKAGSVIVRNHALCDQLFFILKGELSALTTTEKQDLTLIEHIRPPYVLEPYSLFGISTRYNSTYTAITEVHTVSIAKSFLLSELFNYEIFRINFMNILSSRAQVLYNRIWAQAPTDVEGKIIHFILIHAEKQSGEKSMKVKMEDLARYLDDTRLNISKALNTLQDENLIALHRKEIVIPELSLLAERLHSAR